MKGGDGGEFQVIVLAAGKGSRITELTTKRAKCLLSIGNKPMIYYPLKLIEKAGFKDVILLVAESVKRELESVLEKSDLTLNVNSVTIPNDADWGTADSLRYISSYINSDFIVVSSDLLTTIDIKCVLDFHRKTDASLTAMYFQSSPSNHTTTPGHKSKNKSEKDLLAVDPYTNRLVFFASASDYEDFLPLKKKLLDKHGYVRIYTKLVDSHFFIMKKSLIDYINSEKNLSTLKGELLPNVVKDKRVLLNGENNKANDGRDLSTEPTVADAADEFSFYTKQQPTGIKREKFLSSYNDHKGDLHSVYMNEYVPSYAFIVPHNELGIRNNTLQEYCKSNRLIMQYWKQLVGENVSNISDEAKIHSTQLDRDTCCVGSHTRICSKTSVKFSIIGSGCTIESKTRISDSVIMNHVTIKEGCVIHNCIICDDVTIEMNSTIKDCIIGFHYLIPANSNHANEVLAEMGNLMEV